MNPLAKLLALAPMLLNLPLRGGEPRIQESVLDEHVVHVIPVSVIRVTTISFPLPIAAIDAALATVDGKTPGLFQIAHSKGTAYLSARALVNGAVTNLNIRCNERTYVLELHESDQPCYSISFKARPDREGLPPSPLTPTRLLGLVDKAKAFPLLKEYHRDAVANVEHRDLHARPQVSDCGEYELKLTEAFRFPEQDTVVFQLAATNHGPVTLTHVPERMEVRIGDKKFLPSLSDLPASLAPRSTAVAYIAVSGTPEHRNNLSLKNDFTFVLSLRDPEVEAAVRGFKDTESFELPK